MFQPISWGILMSAGNVLENITGMVVKKTNGSGGYGSADGTCGHPIPKLQTTRRKSSADPRQFIAQPVISLSSAPCYI